MRSSFWKAQRAIKCRCFSFCQCTQPRPPDWDRLGKGREKSRTDLHRHNPTFKKYARRLLESVAREINKSYRTYFKHPNVGRPNTASPYRNRTLEISEPSVEHLKVKPSGWATIQIKGLPTIRLRTDDGCTAIGP